MAKRVNNEPLRALAEKMFVEEGMTAKAIASSIDVTEQTIGRWRKGIQEISHGMKSVNNISQLQTI